jgi:tetratricopeptide (TPR) repeat protein
MKAARGRALVRLGTLFFSLGLPAQAFGQSVYSAQVLEQAGQVEAAWLEYRQVLDHNPQDLAAFSGYSRLSRSLSRYDSLAALSRRLQADYPEVPEFALGQVEALLGLRRRNEALAQVRAFGRKWPERSNSLADALERGGEFGAAIDVLLQAAEQGKARAALAPRLVELYEKDGQWQAATREIAAIANLSPASIGPHLPRLRSYAARTDPAALGRELDAIADAAAAARAKAAVFVGAGRTLDAVRVLKPVVGTQELYVTGRQWEGEGYLQAALAAYSETGMLADQARVLRRLGRPDEALGVLARDSGPGATFELAELYRLEQRDFSRAAGAYERVLRRRPADEPALFGLAAAQLGMRELDRAGSTLARVRQSTDRVLLLQAQLAFYRGDMDSCRTLATRLAGQFPQSVVTNDGLELALLCSGGARAETLGLAMLDYEAGAGEPARRRAAALARGSDAVAGQAVLLMARLYRREGRPGQAVAVLDSVPAGSGRVAARAGLERAYVYRDDLNDDGLYRRALEDVVLKYPNSAYAPIARSLLAEAERATEPGGVR